ncbi:protein SINE3 [Vigna unguiculata]|uniref:protein SINE3 n=1 Tax=Vigna unguiculata TaxID=3917 RepID=UPI001016F6F2|nr:protein SINE3 [Vigna unguiculata]
MNPNFSHLSFFFSVFNFRLNFSALISCRQIADKSLNAAFASVSEDSVDLSPFSEISDTIRNEDLTTFFLEEPSSVTLLPSDLTPKKLIDKTGSISSTSCTGADEIDCSKFNSVEAEITVNFLRNVKTEFLNSVNAAPQRRIELLDRIIEYVVSDLQTYTLPEESDQFVHLISMKKRMLFLFTFIWVIGVSAVLFFTSDTRSPYRGPRPT